MEINPKSSPFYLSASGSFADPAELSASLPKEFNGLPIHFKWQDAAIAGQWKHPTKGFTLSIDNARIDKWVKGIELARSNGVDLPIVKDHKETADSTLGYIYGARQNNGRLELLNGYIGDDALKIAQRNKLSIGIDPNFKDSHGTSYGEAIRHVAVTPIPVIHGQQGFLAASRDGQQEPEYLIPVAKETNDMTLTDEQRKEICDVLGVEHVDDDAAISLLTATVTDLQTECLTLSAAKDEATKQITELSAAQAVEPEVFTPSASDIENAKLRIELSATKGDIPEWLGKALKAKLDATPLLLSRDGDDKPTLVCDILAMFDGAKLGVKTQEKTGVQTLSRDVPDGEKPAASKVNPWKADIEAVTSHTQK